MAVFLQSLAESCDFSHCLARFPLCLLSTDPRKKTCMFFTSHSITIASPTPKRGRLAHGFRNRLSWSRNFSLRIVVYGKSPVFHSAAACASDLIDTEFSIPDLRVVSDLR